jgi:catechol 2,3-dioxygenase-like lactoylglutathione lyase family enzyme
MTQESAVQFSTARRIHMGIAVRDLAKSIAFYRVLFGQEPTKTRPRYAKFEVAEPSVNLSLNETGGPTGPNNPLAHFGIQVKSTAAVKAAAGRLTEAGLPTQIEEEVTCCYAVQDKVWATDPDGNKWEVYVVLDNNGATHAASQGECCPGMPKIIESVQRQDLAGATAALAEAGGLAACSRLGKLESGS